jgi:NTP pyrophosphatase (non-canonical NTP hydrolase)
MNEYQMQVLRWLNHCFSENIVNDKVERQHRFLEEALELVQAGGCTAHEAHQLVDYVFGRDVGELRQEVGGVMVTLAALCGAYGVSMADCADDELERVWLNIAKIRAKSAAKPKFLP